MWLAQIAIVILIIFFVARFFIRKHKSLSNKERDWYLQVFLSKEDGVSQAFFLLSVLFLGVALLSINRNFGDPLSWRTIIFITSLVGLGVGYYFKAIYTIIVGLLGLTFWWGIQAAWWLYEMKQTTDTMVKPIYVFIGLAFVTLLYYMAGRVYEKDIKFKRLALVYFILGLFSVTAMLFFLSLKSGIEALEEMTQGLKFFASWQITISLFIFVIVSLASLFYVFSKKLVLRSEALVLFIITLLFIILMQLPEINLINNERSYGLSMERGLTAAGALWAIIFNIVIFLHVLGIIFLGYLRKENYLVNIGTFILFILIIVKYFDWFFASLDKSIFFIGAGILLFIVGWFMEKGRRYMLSNIEEGKITTEPLNNQIP